MACSQSSSSASTATPPASDGRRRPRRRHRATRSPPSPLRRCGAASRVGRSPADLVETSGLVASRRPRGVLWSHDDSGGNAELFALGLDGADLGRVERRRVPGGRLGGHRPAARARRRARSPRARATSATTSAAASGRIPSASTSSTSRRRPGRCGQRRSAPGHGVHPELRRRRTRRRDAPRRPSPGDLFVVSKQWDGTDAGVYRIPGRGAPWTGPRPLGHHGPASARRRARPATSSPAATCRPTAPSSRSAPTRPAPLGPGPRTRASPTRWPDRRRARWPWTSPRVRPSPSPPMAAGFVTVSEGVGVPGAGAPDALSRRPVAPFGPVRARARP